MGQLSPAMLVAMADGIAHYWALPMTVTLLSEDEKKSHDAGVVHFKRVSTQKWETEEKEIRIPYWPHKWKPARMRYSTDNGVVVATVGLGFPYVVKGTDFTVVGPLRADVSTPGVHGGN
jgi:hypothetical protein